MREAIKDNEKSSIWIIDDEIDLGQTYADLLEDSYNVQVFDSPSKALSSFSGNPKAVDIIITDLMMPDMDGLTLSKHIKQINPSTDIVMMSGFLDRDKLLAASELNISAFLSKPINFDKLTNILKHTISTKRHLVMKEELQHLLLLQNSLTTTLLSKYEKRFIEAENIIFEHNLPLYNQNNVLEHTKNNFSDSRIADLISLNNNKILILLEKISDKSNPNLNIQSHSHDKLAE